MSALQLMQKGKVRRRIRATHRAQYGPCLQSGEKILLTTISAKCCSEASPAGPRHRRHLGPALEPRLPALPPTADEPLATGLTLVPAHEERTAVAVLSEEGAEAAASTAPAVARDVEEMVVRAWGKSVEWPSAEIAASVDRLPAMLLPADFSEPPPWPHRSSFRWRVMSAFWHATEQYTVVLQFEHRFKLSLWPHTMHFVCEPRVAPAMALPWGAASCD